MLFDLLSAIRDLELYKNVEARMSKCDSDYEPYNLLGDTLLSPKYFRSAGGYVCSLVVIAIHRYCH